MEVKRGNIVICDLDGAIGSEQGKTRACVILQNDVGNRYSPTTIIAPLTTKIKNMSMPTHAFIYRNNTNNLKEDSMVMCEQIRTVDKSRIQSIIGMVDNGDMSNIFKAYLANFGT